MVVRCLSRLCPLVLVLWTLGFSAPALGQGAPPPDPQWPGRYAGSGVELLLQAGEGGSLAGSLTYQGQTYPVAARVEATGLSGTFQVQEHAYPFTVRQVGSNQFVLETGGQTYRIQGTEATPSPKSPAAIPKVGDDPAWKSYRHALGFTMRYPAGWRVEAMQDALSLIPSDQLSNEQGPTEAYVISSTPTEGVTRPDDPRAIAFADQQLTAMFPFLTRQGAPEPAPAGTRAGVVMTWSGRGPTGMDIRARLYMTIIDGNGVLFLAVGDARQITTRERTVRAIFQTFGLGPGVQDPRILGHWRSEKHFFSGPYSSTTIRYLLLRADGACFSGSRTLASLEHHDPGGEKIGTSNRDLGDSDTLRGRWAAAEGKLHLTWPDGTEATWQYHVEGDAMLWQSDGLKRLYERVR